MGRTPACVGLLAIVLGACISRGGFGTLDDGSAGLPDDMQDGDSAGSTPALTIGAPSQTTMNSSGSVTFIVTYSGASSVALTPGEVTFVSTGNATCSVGVSNGTSSTPTVTLSACTGDGTVRISINPGTAESASGNPDIGAGPSAALSIDNTPPSLVIGAPSDTSIDSSGRAAFIVTYAGASTVDLTDTEVTLNSTGDATCQVVVTGGSTSTPTITVEACTGDGSVDISIAAGTATDTAGNAAPAAGPSQSVAVVNTVSMPRTPLLVQNVGANSGAVAPSLSVAFPIANTGGNLLVVSCNTTANTTGLNISDSQGNGYNVAVTRAGATEHRSTIFYAANIADGPNTVTCIASPIDFLDMMANEYSGTLSTSPLDDVASALGTSSTPALTVATSAAGGLVVGKVHYSSTSTGTPGLFYLPRRHGPTLGGVEAQDAVMTPAGGQVLDATLTGVEPWIYVGATFKPAGGTTNASALYFIGGISEVASVYSNRRTVQKSIDEGRTWTSVGNLPGYLDSHCALYFDNALWVLGGYTGSANTSTVLKSLDGGATWAAAGNLPAPRDAPACLVYDGKMWVIGGSSAYSVDTGVDTVFSSSDGATWTTVGTLPVVASDIAGGGVVFNGKMWVAGGTDLGNNALTGVYWSVDGISWSTAGIPALPSARRAGSMAVHNNRMWYLGGNNAGNVGQTTVWSCTDPCAAWTVHAQLPALLFRGAAASVNGRLLTMGAVDITQGYYTTDGTTWGINVDRAPISWGMGALVATPGAPPASAIVFQQLKENSDATASSTFNTGAFAGSVARGNLMVCWAHYNSSARTIASMTDTAGNFYARAIGPGTGVGTLANWHQEIWYAADIGGSAFSVTATLSASLSAQKNLSCHEYYGAALVNPLDATSGSTGNSATPSAGSVTTTSPNQLIFAAATFGFSASAGPGYVQRSWLWNNVSEDVFVRGTGTLTPRFTVPSPDDFLAHVVTFRAK